MTVRATVFTSRHQPASTAMANTLRSIARSNRNTIEVVDVDIDDDPATAVARGVITCPTILVDVDGDERARLGGIRSRRTLLHVLLPLAYDPDEALSQLRRQLGSPHEQFPRRTARRVAKVGQASRAAMLGSVPLFAGLTRKGLRDLAAACHEVVVGDAAVIVEEGQPGDEFFVVVEGSVGVSSRGGVAVRLGAGDSFGEMSLLDDGPRTATVTATGPTTLLAIDRDTFRSLLAASPDTSVILLQTLAARLRERD